jgi:hypothetical protein
MVPAVQRGRRRNSPRFLRGSTALHFIAEPHEVEHVTTIALWMSSGALLGALNARGVDAIRQETGQERGLAQEFDSGLLDEPGPGTESSLERGFRVRGPVDDEWGQSESIDPDNVGDIADEGLGHRG